MHRSHGFKPTMSFLGQNTDRPLWKTAKSFATPTTKKSGMPRSAWLGQVPQRLRPSLPLRLELRRSERT